MLITTLRELARLRHAACSDDAFSDDEGATAVEYALLVGLIAVIIISSVTLLGGNIDAMFNDVANQLGGGTSTT